MESLMLNHPDFYSWVILPLLIFFARICDVSLGTVRILFVARGQKYHSAFIGFFEVFIWIIVVTQVMQNLNNYLCYFAYAGGFAMGNFVGIKLEEKIALGIVLIRVITRKNASDLIRQLRVEGHGVTSLRAEGMEGPVDVFLSTVKRHDLRDVIEMIRKSHPAAFYTVENVQAVREGTFPRRFSLDGHMMRKLFTPHRKGK